MQKTTVPAILVAWIAMLSGCGPIPTLSQLIMRPTHGIRATPDDYGYNYDEVTVPVAEGREVVVWHVLAEASKGIVVVLPGAAANKSDYLYGLATYVDDGYDVIIVDYEGFGQSPGQATLRNAADDAVAVANYALTRSDKVVIYGVSLGSPPAAYAAAKCPVSGLILEGSLILTQEPEQWLRWMHLYIPQVALIASIYTDPQVPDSWNILKYVAQADCPKLIMHSVEDNVMPFVTGQEVFDAASKPKTFCEMKYEHGQMIRQEPEVYYATIRGWLDSTLGLPSAISE